MSLSMTESTSYNRQAVRPFILAMIDGAVSVGVLTVSGLVSPSVAFLAVFAGAAAMAIGEWVSVENGGDLGAVQLSPTVATIFSAIGFALGSLPAAVATLVALWWVPLVVSGSVLVVLAVGIGWVNGRQFGFRALVFGELALGVSWLMGVL